MNECILVSLTDLGKAQIYPCPKPFARCGPAIALWLQECVAEKKRGRRIQAAAPAAEGRRVRNAIRIFHRWGGAFPRVVLHKTSPQRLTARDQTVMGIRQGESGKKTESMFAEFAEPAAVLDPVVTVVMRLLAPPAMTDDRIAQTEGTPAKDRFRTSRPVEARLAMIRRKWDKGNRTALEALLRSGTLARNAHPEESLLLPAHSAMKA
jgi:hypothetical protein